MKNIQNIQIGESFQDSEINGLKPKHVTIIENHVYLLELNNIVLVASDEGNGHGVVLDRYTKEEFIKIRETFGKDWLNFCNMKEYSVYGGHIKFKSYIYNENMSINANPFSEGYLNKDSFSSIQEKNYAGHGIFIDRENCNDSTFKLLFNTNNSVGSFDKKSSKNVLKLLLVNGLLKNDFSGETDQKRLKESFKRFFVEALLKQNYLGFFDTFTLLKSLQEFSISKNNLSFYHFFEDIHFTNISNFSYNVDNNIYIAYAKLLKDNLDQEIMKEILLEIKSHISKLDRDKMEIISIEKAFDRFSKEILSVEDYYSIYL